jgi:hypothetical protein
VNDNTWQMVQIFMWAQAVILMTLMSAFYSSLSGKLEKIYERLTRVHNDMIEVKTVLRREESCMIKDESQFKKDE